MTFTGSGASQPSPDAGQSRAQALPASQSTPWSSDLATWPKSDLKDVADEIARLGLVRNVAELEMFGFTIVHADQTGARALTDRALERMCDFLEQDNGVRPDLKTGATHVNIFGRSLGQILHRDRVFQELLLHPMALALVTYLLGNMCHFSGSALFMKGPVDASNPNTSKNAYYVNKTKRMQLGLHCDILHRPAPFSAIPELCNVHWLLTDYSDAEGALALVPGSHRALRHPMELEGEDDAIAVTAPAGSFVLFTGATWHGSLPRTVPGIRAGMPLWYCRANMARNEDFEGIVTPELLEGMPPRFATLMGMHRVAWNAGGPKIENLKKWPVRPGYFT